MSKIAEVLQKQHTQVLDGWLKNLSDGGRRSDLISDKEVKDQATELLGSIIASSRSGNVTDVNGTEWATTRQALQGIAASRAQQGFTSSETATFVLSLKQPIFAAIRTEFGKDPDVQYQEIWAATILLDKLALLTTEGFIATKEKMIARQQEELLELSTPVVKLWEGILALPMIGTLDSARTQVVMESLLQAIVETNSKVAIIDITGVPTVDTLVAQHLIKTITAARLMGADCIISGIRPQIAQTIVHLGINLADVTTKAKLSDAFALALSKSGRTVVKISDATATRTPSREA
jgi:rsbT co-antagonist protein RsbR